MCQHVLHVGLEACIATGIQSSLASVTCSTCTRRHTHQVYYWNHETQEASWVKPSEHDEELASMSHNLPPAWTAIRDDDDIYVRAVGRVPSPSQPPRARSYCPPRAAALLCSTTTKRLARAAGNDLPKLVRPSPRRQRPKSQALQLSLPR